MIRAIPVFVAALLWSWAAYAQPPETCGGITVDHTVTGTTTAEWDIFSIEFYRNETIDFYFRTTSALTVQKIFLHQDVVDPGEADSQSAIVLKIENNHIAASTSNGALGNMSFKCDGDVTPEDNCPAVSINTWYHVVIERQLSGSTLWYGTTSSAHSTYTASIGTCGGALTAFATGHRQAGPEADNGSGTIDAPQKIKQVHISSLLGVTLDIADGVAASSAGMNVDLGPWPEPAASYNPSPPHPALSTISVCDGISWPADQNNAPLAGAPTNVLSSYELGCAGAYLGTDANGYHLFGTAGHCVRTGDVPKYSALGYVTTQPWSLTTYPYKAGLTVSVSSHPDYGTGTNVDMAMLRLPPSISWPVPAAPIYDFVNDKASCTAIWHHGNGECRNIIFPWDGSTNGLKGYCADPISYRFKGGDSGGPIYATGDWGSGFEWRWMGNHSGGGNFGRWNLATGANLTWVQQQLAGAPLSTSFGGGVTLYGFWIDSETYPWEEDPTAGIDSHDILSGPMPAGCAVHATASPNPVVSAGCTASNPKTGKRISCDATTHTNNIYRCYFQIPQHSGSQWEISDISVTTTAGRFTRKTKDFIDNWPTVAVGHYLPLSPSREPRQGVVTIDANWPPASPAPGGETTCILKRDGGTVPVKHASCSYSSVSYPETLSCDGPDDVSGANGRYLYCDFKIPSDVPTGSVWVLDRVSAKSVDDISSSSTLGDGFTIFDCNATPTSTFTGTAGTQWSTDTPITNTSGYEAEYVFYARASQPGLAASVALGEYTIAGDSDARIGVRFEANGTISHRGNGAWNATSYAWSPGVWYKFRIHGTYMTILNGSPAATYDAFVEPCGGRVTKLADNQAVGPRLYTGIEHMNLYAADGQTIDLAGTSFRSMECPGAKCSIGGFATGETFCSASAPDGCGGTIPDFGSGDCQACTGGDVCQGPEYNTCVTP